jgi:hypothetical protein
VKKFSIVFGLFLTLFPAAFSPAAPTISCHCFRDRSFDPSRPAAADEYFLATVQNSLMAAVFPVDKRELVRAKMSGQSGEELWISQYLAVRTSRPAQALLDARNRTDSWREAAEHLGIDPEALGPRFYAVLVGGGDSSRLTRAAVDDTLIERLGSTPEAVENLRKQGANDQETVMAAFLSRETGRATGEVFAAVRSGKTTWGRLLHEWKLSGETIENELRRMVR